MKIELKNFEEKEKWNSFVEENFDFYSFLDSWEWGEFQKLDGTEIFRFGIYEEGELVGLLFLILIKAKRGNFLFCPHGPLIKKNYFKILGALHRDLKNLAKENGASFLRLNPITKNTKNNWQNYKICGYKDAPMHMHAEDTHLLDLTKNEEDLLKNMRKTTRYIINRAKKEGVKIFVDNSKEGLEKLIKMHKEHSHRTNGKNTYGAFSASYIKNLIKAFGEKATVMRADFEGFTEAMLMTIKFGKTCVYYIGASEIRHPKFSPAYLLQFEAILKAKSEACTIYNFWGVSPDDNPKHPIAGVTKFKRGFSGEDYSLSHAQDFIFDKTKYTLNYLVERFRRFKRGYYYKKPE